MPQVDNKSFQIRMLNLIVSHLSQVISQASPTDDHILLDHVRRAHAAAMVLMNNNISEREAVQ